MGSISEAPLAETGRRLDAIAPYLGFRIGDPSGDAWFGLDQVVAAGVVDRMAADLLAQEGRRDVAGSYLGSHLAGPVVARTVAAMVLDRRCPDPDPSNVVVHLHPDGWFDRVWFRTPAAAVVDAEAVHDWWAARLVACLAPLLDATRARLPSGRRGLWGAVADRVAASALTVARHAGHPCEPAWDEVTRLLDALSRHAPVPLTRPSPFLVRSPHGRDGLFPVRGTCCLYYLTVDRPDPCGDGYCTTCPFTDPAHRHRTLAALVDQHEARR